MPLVHLNLCFVYLDFCDADNTSDPSIGEYFWPDSRAGQTAILPCAGAETKGNATRMCSETGDWLDVNVDGCPGFCSADFTITETGNYTWPTTAAGRSYTQPCGLTRASVNGEVLEAVSSEAATRECNSKGNWLDVDDTMCLTFISQQYVELNMSILIVS